MRGALEGLPAHGADVDALPAVQLPAVVQQQGGRGEGAATLQALVQPALLPGLPTLGPARGRGRHLERVRNPGLRGPGTPAPNPAPELGCHLWEAAGLSASRGSRCNGRLRRASSALTGQAPGSGARHRLGAQPQTRPPSHCRGRCGRAPHPSSLLL